jgi:hypothetical protein
VRRFVPVSHGVLLTLAIVFGVLSDAPDPAVAQKTAQNDFRLAAPTTQVLPAKAGATRLGAVSNGFRALQLNLCHGGIAPCGDDATLPEIDALLRRLSGSRTPPDLISLNEVCRNDIAGHLISSMADVWPADKTFFMFAPAVDGNNRTPMAPYPCANGDAYGNAIIGHISDRQYRGLAAMYGVYAVQSSDPEKRSFGCLHVAGHYDACTTHLEAESAPVAMTQCRTLLNKVVPFFKRQEGTTVPTVVAGDLNLRDDTSSRDNVQRCAPAGYRRQGDGELMHVMATTDIVIQRTDRFGLKHTDHNAFMVTMALP